MLFTGGVPHLIYYQSQTTQILTSAKNIFLHKSFIHIETHKEMNLHCSIISTASFIALISCLTLNAFCHISIDIFPPKYQLRVFKWKYWLKSLHTSDSSLCSNLNSKSNDIKEIFRNNIQFCFGQKSIQPCITKLKTPQLSFLKHQFE